MHNHKVASHVQGLKLINLKNRQRQYSLYRNREMTNIGDLPDFTVKKRHYVPQTPAILL